MDIVGELIQDPRYKAFIIECLKELQEGLTQDLDEQISEEETRIILGSKDKPISQVTLAIYRRNGLPHNNKTRPFTYIRRDVIEYRDGMKRTRKH